MYHLLSCLKKIPLYRYFSDFKSHCGFSIAGSIAGSQFEKGICVLNLKYIKWKCFLGIL